MFVHCSAVVVGFIRWYLYGFCSCIMENSDRSLLFHQFDENLKKNFNGLFKLVFFYHILF